MKKSLFLLITFVCSTFCLQAQNTFPYPATGNIGFGTTTPKEQFQIGDKWTFHNGGSKFIGYNLYYNGQLQRFANGAASQLVFDGTGEIVLKTADITTPLTSLNIGLAVKPNGNVGIGHSAPTEKLDILGNLRIRGNLHSDGADFKLGLSDGRPQGTKLLNRALVHSNAADALILNYDGDFEGGVEDWGPKMYIKGKLGVGVESPTEKFEVDGNARIRGNLFSGGAEFRLGVDDGRFQGTKLENRALVHNTLITQAPNIDALIMNFNGDFEAGVQIQGPQLSVQGKTIVGGNLLANKKMIVGYLFETAENMPAGYSLYVREGILTEKIRVATAGTPDWADYVFEKDYKLMPLKELEAYIQSNKHLPNIPSSQEVSEHGIDLAQINARLLEKVEELTLHLIEQQKQIEALKKQTEEVLNKLNASKN